ncbi:restriction endonuclease [Pectobacterium sp. CHL-2024]|uniref:restriction endonuclease n=1 Tax=Pectobacterium TaxID=122277 RepID=UPI002A83FF02|nr:restriction endonuclease [Pectobacterium brasiliense]MDY4324207.1 restriction endonuclease [Pectobacterium brasiliense]
MIETPTDLESYMQYVYSCLLNLQNEGVVVSRRAVLKGKSTNHEIDVFYQFERAGVIHKVAIECKYLSRPVEKKDVMAFRGRLEDIGNIQGIMVSKLGYQKGAYEYAKYYDIELKTIDNIPTLNIITAEQAKAGGLPSKQNIGQPFWILMEKYLGNVDAVYYGIKDDYDGKATIPLFLSKRDAIKFLNTKKLQKKFAIRGLTQRNLEVLIGFCRIRDWKFYLMPSPHGLENIGGVIITPDALKDNYLISEITEIEYSDDYFVKPKKKGVSLARIVEELMDSRSLELLKNLKRK